MNKKTRIVTILASPSKQKSNTKALVEDFVLELQEAGLSLDHQIISLREKKVNPCLGCWNCTKDKPCPINDDLDEIKEAMIACDMLIIATPVYTNQVTAQLKAFFDRLFTWCHIFPLLGKYSLSACTTGNDGIKPTADFMEKMLATYGTYSFGTISSIGGFNSGVFPFREKAREKNKKLAGKIARMINEGKYPSVSKIQKEMFKAMYRKMSGANTFRHMIDAEYKSDIVPPKFKLNLIKKILRKNNITDEYIDEIATMMKFEYSWWVERGWLNAKSFKQLSQIPVPENFDHTEWLLRNKKMFRQTG